MKLKIFLLFMICTLFAYGWDDHPDLPDHSESDRIFKAAQEQTGAEEYERLMAIEKEKQEFEDYLKGIFPDEISDFKDGKFRRDEHDRS